MSTRKILTPTERFLPEKKSFCPAWGGLVGKQSAQGTWGAWVQGQGLLLQFPFLLPSIIHDVDTSGSERERITPSSVIF